MKPHGAIEKTKNPYPLGWVTVLDLSSCFQKKIKGQKANVLMHNDPFVWEIPVCDYAALWDTWNSYENLLYLYA